MRKTESYAKGICMAKNLIEEFIGMPSELMERRITESLPEIALSFHNSSRDWGEMLNGMKDTLRNAGYDVSADIVSQPPSNILSYRTGTDIASNMIIIRAGCNQHDVTQEAIRYMKEELPPEPSNYSQFMMLKGMENEFSSRGFYGAASVIAGYLKNRESREMYLLLNIL